MTDLALSSEDAAALEADAKFWLDNGGRKQIQAAMVRAKQTSEEFVHSTQVRYETLYEQYAHAAPIVAPHRPHHIPLSKPMPIAYYPGYKGAPR